MTSPQFQNSTPTIRPIAANGGRTPRLMAAAVNGYLLIVVTTAVLAAPFDIALSPAAMAREQVTEIAVRWVLFTAVLLLGLPITYHCLLRRLDHAFGARDLRASVALLAFPILCIVSTMANGDAANMRTLVTTVVLPLSIYAAFKTEAFKAATIRLVFLALVASVLILTYYFVSIDAFDFVRSDVLPSLYRPQLKTSLLQSTEMSDILGEVIIIGIYAAIIETNKLLRTVVMVGIAPMVLLFIAMGSLGSFVVLSALLALLVARDATVTVRYRNAAHCLVALGLVAIVCGLMYQLSQGDLGSSLADKLLSDRRNTDYEAELEMARSMSLFGEGRRYVFDTLGVYPHHNILGTLIERGVLACAGYMIILITAAIFLVKSAVRRERHTGGAHYLFMKCMACCAAFLVLRGFVHDTWPDPSFPVWTGGLFAWLTYAATAPGDGKARVIARNHVGPRLWSDAAARSRGVARS